MKRSLLVVVAVLAAVVALWLNPGGAPAAAGGGGPSAGMAADGGADTDLGRVRVAGGAGEVRRAVPGDDSLGGVDESDRDAAGAGRAAGQSSAVADGAGPATRWQAMRQARVVQSSAQAQTPAVTAELAFLALRYVGVDPQAERTWRRAIDDPATPQGLRSDLIEDLNQEGYQDNGHPTAEDLPLIRARLALIERLAPHAIDEVNRAAFEEAYNDLLDMYVRLGGDPNDL